MTQLAYATKVLAALAAEGWTVTSTNHDPEARTPRAALNVLKDVEDLRVYVTNGRRNSFLYFVWQGPNAEVEEGEEILCDYGMTLNPIIERLDSQPV